MDRIRARSLSSWRLTVLIGTWGCCLLGTSVAMVRYQMTPGPMSVPASVRWPTTAQFAPDRTHPTLVMSLHPQCPCSRASLDDLQSLISHTKRPVAVHLLFVSPRNAPPGWLDGALWRDANAMPNVSVSIDRDGIDAVAFGATTSGAVALYDINGNLIFHGGITDGRAHEGDSAGASAILSLLRGKAPRVSQTPVYGCSLRGSTFGHPPANASRNEGKK